jgi:hypothetical protein
MLKISFLWTKKGSSFYGCFKSNHFFSKELTTMLSKNLVRMMFVGVAAGLLLSAQSTQNVPSVEEDADRKEVAMTKPSKETLGDTQKMSAPEEKSNMGCGCEKAHKSCDTKCDAAPVKAECKKAHKECAPKCEPKPIPCEEKSPKAKGAAKAAVEG